MSIATTIVTNDTSALVSQADNIVRGCTGLNCNTSIATRTSITQNSSRLAQEQSRSTLSALGIPSSSTLGRQIYEGYLELGAAVASVYNFQCGNSTVNSLTCVSNASSVQTAQINLVSLLSEPISNDINHITALSILSTITLIAFIVFFIFFMISIAESLEETPKYILTKPIVAQPIIVQPIVAQPMVNPVMQVTPIATQPQYIDPVVPINNPPIATPASPYGPYYE